MYERLRASHLHVKTHLFTCNFHFRQFKISMTGGGNDEKGGDAHMKEAAAPPLPPELLNIPDEMLARLVEVI